MKKLILSFVAGMVFFAMLAMSFGYIPNKSTSEVNKLEGLYVYIECSPVLDYEVLGEVKGSFSDMGYNDVKNSLVRNTRKKYKDADGVIMYMRPGRIDRGDAIRFIETGTNTGQNLEKQ